MMIKQQAIGGSGEMAFLSTALLWKELCPDCPRPPEARLCLGTRKRRTPDFTQRPFFKESRHRQMRISCTPSAPKLVRAMSRPCITARPVGRLLRPLQRAAFFCRISASQARIRMHCHEGMHLFLVQGSFLGQPKTDRPHDAAP